MFGQPSGNFCNDRAMTDLSTLLELDDAFAVETYVDFPKKTPPASGTIEEALREKTGCASMLVIAGCMLWVARRLGRVSDVSLCYRAAEALLCYQAHPAYFGTWPTAAEPQDAAERAVRAIAGCLRAVQSRSPGRHSCWPPAEFAGRAVSITRAVLGASGKRLFEEWLKELLARLELIASNPRFRVGTIGDFESPAAYAEQVKINVGAPLPPDLLRMKERLAPEQLGALYAAFLESVQWRDNPLLASPESMRERGFQDTPYRIEAKVHVATAAAPSAPGVSVAPSFDDPYPFLAALAKLPEKQRPDALAAHLAASGKPAWFGPTELKLEHAFSSMLGLSVAAAAGTYVGILATSSTVIGDLSVLSGDHRPRPPAVRGFEPTITAGPADEVRELLHSAVAEEVLAARMLVEPGDFIAVRSDDVLIGRITREELAEIEDDLLDLVEEVEQIAPSDGTLFDALRFMVQKEEEPWGMSLILDVCDLSVDRIDPKMAAALERVQDEALVEDLSAFCDDDGRSARAWRWRGHDRQWHGGQRLSFVAGIYDGEGVGMDFDIYRVA